MLDGLELTSDEEASVLCCRPSTTTSMAVTSMPATLANFLGTVAVKPLLVVCKPSMVPAQE